MISGSALCNISTLALIFNLQRTKDFLWMPKNASLGFCRSISMSIAGQKLFMTKLAPSRLSQTFVSDMKIDNRCQYLMDTKQSTPMSEEKEWEKKGKMGIPV